MMSLLRKRARREACRQVIAELFRYNSRDDCWDPVGSIDRAGLDNAIELIAQDKMDKRGLREVKGIFERRRKRR